ncbi:MAG: UTP--glucose-1-phosphate uridylyltransferase GalU [Methanoregula sp.]|uniref:UTP--glucose-1-phosphate uridylyltransferase GalU n=1 Tax=Methanoregula sp. TaxID=2052170 RepID=UPI0025CC9367|nr:UTP--glucose-1-phosphate uridylyltransferase GalU [Methanoregula sp.]MCK9631798.1 UTP--glucose-1-phosphate uridylyltransferase GalU [Methanoregula sp.]
MRKKQNIHKAVIPAAGLGTRFLPVTKSMPKEMLPIIDKPVIHYVVEEAVKSGIDDIIIITGRGKRAIEDYFDAAPELEMRLKDQHNDTTLNRLREIADFPTIHYVRQKEPNGLGDAILRAENHIGNEPFAVLLGDDIITNSKPCTAQLMTVYSRFTSSVISIEHVPREKVCSYGIIKGNAIEPDLVRVEDIVEKPEPDKAPSDMGAVGRYIFVPEIFDCLKNTNRGVGNEIQLTDAIKLLLKDHPVYAYQFEGKRYDTGDKLGYIETIIDFALRDPHLNKAMMEYLQKRICS